MKVLKKISKKNLFELYSEIISVIVGIESFVEIFIEISFDYKMIAVILNLTLFIIVFVVVVVYANHMDEVTLNLDSVKLVVKFGDMFSEQGKKVISCNEYFDSVVDETLISSKSLHGYVMNTYITDVDDFDKKLVSYEGCNKNILGKNRKKTLGKQIKYKLGTCFKYQDFVFVAFTKFDDKYRAYLDLPSYFFCVSNFWNDLNRVYNGDNIVVPLMGSGITRMENNSLSKQEQLQIFIDALKASNLSFKHDSKITVVLSEKLRDEIKLFNIRR